MSRANEESERKQAARDAEARATRAGWETFAHGADIGVRGRGPDCERAFESAALALTSVMTDPACVYPLQRVDVRCNAPDEELLLYGWLNALITEMAVRSMIFSRFEVAIAGTELRGAAWGEPVDVARHHPAVEPKGATLTALEVRRAEDGAWVAQCIVDV